MIVKATPQSIRSIIRRCTIKPDSALNILTFCTHERYEQNLCRTGHNFYSLNHGKQWDTNYGIVPDNYYEVSEVPLDIPFDLILSHTSCDRIGTSKEIQAMFNIPILRHTHVLPDVRFNTEEQTSSFGNVAVDKNTFISKHNMRSWGYNTHNSSVIEHGIDYDFWSDNQNLPRHNTCLSVVNEWPNRDWCCGWELWKDTVGFISRDNSRLPTTVLGNSPGLSEAASSIEDLRAAYQSSLIFLNTSLHSPVPTSLMEAMAAGCAIVSTNNCMIPEIIEHDHNGLLADSDTELRQLCDALLNDPEKAKQLGMNAQKTISQKYNLNRFVESWNSVFYDLIAQYRK